MKAAIDLQKSAIWEIADLFGLRCWPGPKAVRLFPTYGVTLLTTVCTALRVPFTVLCATFFAVITVLFATFLAVRTGPA